jgi:acyl dehydratase
MTGNSTSALAILREAIGQPHHSSWLVVNQAMINQFADATGDHQFIHVDPARAAQTPFGGTIAHGFLLLSLLPRMIAEMRRAQLPHVVMRVNYGFDRVRFVAPVRSGSRIRVVAMLADVIEKKPGQIQTMTDIVIEIDGVEKPAVTAQWLGQTFVG